MKRQVDWRIADTDPGLKIWEMAGIKRCNWIDVKPQQRYELIKKHKPHWLIPLWKTILIKWSTSYKLLKNRPQGGYLFSSYCKGEAEKATIKFNTGKGV